MSLVFCPQALTALYFFLAGLMVPRHAYLWLMPAAFVACFALKAALAPVASVLVPAYGSLTPAKRAWFAADVVHLVFSLAATIVSGLYIFRVRRGAVPPPARNV